MVSANDGIITESAIYYATVEQSGSETVEANFSYTTDYAALSIWELSGYTAYDLVNSTGSGSSGCCAVSETSVPSNSFVIAGAAAEGAASWTGTTGFNLTSGSDWGSPFAFLMVAGLAVISSIIYYYNWADHILRVMPRTIPGAIISG